MNKLSSILFLTCVFSFFSFNVAGAEPSEKYSGISSIIDEISSHLTPKNANESLPEIDFAGLGKKIALVEQYVDDLPRTDRRYAEFVVTHLRFTINLISVALQKGKQITTSDASVIYRKIAKSLKKLSLSDYELFNGGIIKRIMWTVALLRTLNPHEDIFSDHLPYKFFRKFFDKFTTSTEDENHFILNGYEKDYYGANILSAIEFFESVRLNSRLFDMEEQEKVAGILQRLAQQFGQDATKARAIKLLNDTKKDKIAFEEFKVAHESEEERDESIADKWEYRHYINNKLAKLTLDPTDEEKKYWISEIEFLNSNIKKYLQSNFIKALHSAKQLSYIKENLCNEGEKLDLYKSICANKDFQVVEKFYNEYLLLKHGPFLPFYGLVTDYFYKELVLLIKSYTNSLALLNGKFNHISAPIYDSIIKNQAISHEWAYGISLAMEETLKPDQLIQKEGITKLNDMTITAKRLHSQILNLDVPDDAHEFLFQHFINYIYALWHMANATIFLGGLNSENSVIINEAEFSVLELYTLPGKLDKNAAQPLPSSALLSALPDLVQEKYFSHLVKARNDLLANKVGSDKYIFALMSYVTATALIEKYANLGSQEKPYFGKWHFADDFFFKRLQEVLARKKINNKLFIALSDLVMSWYVAHDKRREPIAAGIDQIVEKFLTPSATKSIKIVVTIPVESARGRLIKAFLDIKTNVEKGKKLPFIISFTNDNKDIVLQSADYKDHKEAKEAAIKILSNLPKGDIIQKIVPGGDNIVISVNNGGNAKGLSALVSKQRIFSTSENIINNTQLEIKFLANFGDQQLIGVNELFNLISIYIKNKSSKPKPQVPQQQEDAVNDYFPQKSEEKRSVIAGFKTSKYNISSNSETTKTKKVDLTKPTKKTSSKNNKPKGKAANSDEKVKVTKNVINNAVNKPEQKQPKQREVIDLYSADNTPTEKPSLKETIENAIDFERYAQGTKPSLQIIAKSEVPEPVLIIDRRVLLKLLKYAHKQMEDVAETEIATPEGQFFSYYSYVVMVGDLLSRYMTNALTQQNGYSFAGFTVHQRDLFKNLRDDLLKKVARLEITDDLATKFTILAKQINEALRIVLPVLKSRLKNENSTETFTVSWDIIQNSVEQIYAVFRNDRLNTCQPKLGIEQLLQKFRLEEDHQSHHARGLIVMAGTLAEDETIKMENNPVHKKVREFRNKIAHPCNDPASLETSVKCRLDYLKNLK